MKIAAKNAKDREEKEKKSLVSWCLGALVAKIFMVSGRGRMRPHDEMLCKKNPT